MDYLAWAIFEMFFHAVSNDWQQMGSPEGSEMSSEDSKYADRVQTPPRVMM